jgi:hypothetical protein
MRPDANFAFGSGFTTSTSIAFSLDFASSIRNKGYRELN